jgi:LysM repeat protein
VTPRDFEVSPGVRIEVINMHTLGDVAIGGNGTLDEKKIQCMFPAADNDYPFSSVHGIDPYEYIDKLTGLCESNRVLRFIITGTPVNIPILLSSVTYGEKDGTGDVYATIHYREYRFIALPKTQKKERTENNSRPVEVAPPPVMQTYVIAKNDTLWAICRKFYGDPLLNPDLARFNNIKNPSIIITGNTLKIPDKSLLRGA